MKLRIFISFILQVQFSIISSDHHKEAEQEQLHHQEYQQEQLHHQKHDPHLKHSYLEEKSSHRPATCQSCRNLVNSFLLGMERTAKGHYGGGDTAWEEERGKIYRHSELRLIEIQEKLCHDITSEQDLCHEIAVDNEELLEEWWMNYKNAGADLYSWLCVTKLAVCCPPDHYGSKCLPCLGFPDNVCSGHGKCKGAGTRKGNGNCTCHTGYTGKVCDSCANDYFAAYSDGGKLICSACHKACKDGCTGAGIKHCNACQPGWEKDDELGCLDENECLSIDSQACKVDEFCVNTEGSHQCIACDKSCNGCYGDGPDMCEQCAENYVLRDKICIDGSTVGGSVHMSMTRYLTYLGLCVATCIIFQKNMAVAGVVGVAVAAYISVSEYILSTTPGI